MDQVILSTEQAIARQQDYVCAGCWGQLNVYLLPEHQARLTCDRCGDGRGFVRRSFTERRRDENVFEARDVRRLLRQIHILQHQPMTEAEILRELGF